MTSEDSRFREEHMPDLLDEDAARRVLILAQPGLLATETMFWRFSKE